MSKNSGTVYLSGLQTFRLVPDEFVLSLAIVTMDIPNPGRSNLEVGCICRSSRTSEANAMRFVAKNTSLPIAKISEAWKHGGSHGVRDGQALGV